MVTEIQVGTAYLDLIQELELGSLMNIGSERRLTDQSDYMLVLGTLIKEHEDEHWPMPCELEERKILRLHHEAWLARETETSCEPS